MNRCNAQGHRLLSGTMNRKQLFQQTVFEHGINFVRDLMHYPYKDTKKWLKIHKPGIDGPLGASWCAYENNVKHQLAPTGAWISTLTDIKNFLIPGFDFYKVI